MKVSVEDFDEVIWFRDAIAGEGMTSEKYKKDGTQDRIVAALEEALHQAKAELSCRDNVN
ncbi:Rrf2 family transcriptional regulator [Enterobacter ludwigii]|jgi:hypothetical protein|uniref:Rrf2 family transcriptional regulator n=1 Tax=Enterobacter ludwigii TaxID=299767 RepID=UPI0010671722|nr:Rrf2 family transcriptional regulator [Enterobacter ludwigii]